MTDGSPIEPNKIADTYQAFSEYHQLVSRLATAYADLTGETESTLQVFADLIGDKRAEFGEATASRNSFTMGEYRKIFGEELPSITTEELTPTEREPLEHLGIIEHKETFHLPCHPHTGRRLHIWPLSDGLNPDYDLLQDFVVPSESVTIFHVSDTHLGYENRVKTGGGGRTKWVDRADSISSFQTVLQQAIKEDVDAIVHTGDIFDHDVDDETLKVAISSIEDLAQQGIKFYYILGDHDRLATGGNIPCAANAVDSLSKLSRTGAAKHCTANGTQLDESPVTVFGIDAAGIGFTEIQHGYKLTGWSPGDLIFDTPQTDGINILCLHETLQESQILEIVEFANQQGQSLDLILLGHEHNPPFDREWQTTVDGVPVACAGPTIPISKYFDNHQPGYNRIRIGANGNLGVDRRELAE